MIGRCALAALLATAGLASEAGAQVEAPAARPAPAADASTDARREKLRQAIERQEQLDRRARELEELAAHPPPQPPGMSDGPQDGGLAIIFSAARWKTQLKREALEARADAEAARPKLDRRKVAALRKQAAKLKAEEGRLTATIAAERKKDARERAERQADMEKAFQGVGGVGLGVPDGGTPARLR